MATTHPEATATSAHGHDATKRKKKKKKSKKKGKGILKDGDVSIDEDDGVPLSVG